MDPTATTAASQGPELKYLSFFRVAILELYFFLFTIYEQLKEKAGPLKLSIERVEGTVQSVVGPVIHRANFNPDDYLKFVDGKVDDTLHYIEDNAPETVKRQAAQLYNFALNLPEKTRAAVDEYNQKGAVATAQGYLDYWIPMAVVFAQKAWQFFFSLPLVLQLYQAVVQPILVGFAEQYNRTLSLVTKSNFPVVRKVATLLPQLPVQKLKRSE